MEEQILGWINSRITPHKDIIAKIFPILLMIGGIVDIIGAVRDRDYMFKPADYERWSHRRMSRQVSLTRGRMTARIYVFLFGIFIIIVGI